MYMRINEKWIEVFAMTQTELYIKLCIGEYREIEFKGVCAF